MKQAEEKGWFLLLVALLGFAGIRGVTGESATRTTAPGEPSKKSPPALPMGSEHATRDTPAPSVPRTIEEREEKQLAVALREESGLDPNGTRSLKELASEIRRNHVLASLMVSVPDPRAGHMGVYFDQVLDALRRGTAAVGLSQGASSIPWSKKKPKDSNVREDGSSPVVSTDESATLGWLLFRDLDERRSLVILLVPESPVLGPPRRVVNAALRILAQLGEDEKPLRILGPFFSGGAEKLSLEISRLGPTVASRVVTGSATGTTVGDRIKEGRTNVSFQRTIADDDQLLEFVLDQITRQNGMSLPPRIAMLSEFDTSFGARLGGKYSCDGPTLTCFRFPSFISQLRVTRLRRETAETEKVEPSLRRTLELELDPEEESVPGTPDPMSELSTYQHELALAQQLGRICGERFDYLILIATDPVDVIFLAQESRKYCPRLTLVTLSADNLFLHPDLRTTLNGTLVGSAYPLLFALPPWRDEAQTQPFASDVAEGFYNAFLALAADLGLTKNEDLLLLDYGPSWFAPDCKSSRLWLTMVAEGRFWPLTAQCSAPNPPQYAVRLPVPQQPQRSDPNHGPSRKPHPEARATGFAIVAALGILCLAALHATATIFAKLARRFPLSGLLRAAASPELRTLQSPYRACAHLSLGLSLLFLLPAGVHVARHGDQLAVVHDWIRIGVMLEILLVAWLLGLAVIECVKLLGELLRDISVLKKITYRNIKVLGFTALAATFLALTAAWVFRTFRLPNLEHQLALTRMLDPIGMSPASPIVYISLGYYFWGLTGLRRIRVLDRVSDYAPILDETSNNARPCPPQKSALEAVIAGLRGSLSGALWSFEEVTLGLLTLLGVYFCVRVLPTFEGKCFDRLLLLGVLVLYLLVALALIQLVLIAGQIQHFLQQLAAHPMVSAYNRIAKKFSGSFGIELRARIPSFEELRISTYSSALLAALSRPDYLGEGLDSAYRDVFEKARDALEKNSRCVDEAFQDLCKTSYDDAKAERKGHEALYEGARMLFGVLRQLWTLRSQSPSRENQTAGLALNQLLPGGSHGNVPTVTVFLGSCPESVFLWMRMAEDFVALRVATFVSHAIFHLKSLLTFALIAGLLLSLAVSSYPLQPQRFVKVFAWSVVGLTVVTAFMLIIRMRRNEILSRLSSTTSGAVGFNFSLLSQLSAYVILPLLVLLSHVFPEIRDRLFPWVGQIQRLFP